MTSAANPHNSNPIQRESDEQVRDQFSGCNLGGSGNVEGAGELSVFLKRVHDDEDLWVRVDHDKIFSSESSYPLAPDPPNRPPDSCTCSVRREKDFMVLQPLPRWAGIHIKERLHGFRLAPATLKRWRDLGEDNTKVDAFAYEPEDGIALLKPGSPNDVVDIDISQQQQEIKFLRLGFDFEQRPVLYATTMEKLSDKYMAEIEECGASHKALLASPGYLKYDVRFYYPCDTPEWSSIDAGLAMPRDLAMIGFWALKADNDDLRVRLVQNWYNGALREIETLGIARKEWQGRLVWEVFFEEAP